MDEIIIQEEHNYSDRVKKIFLFCISLFSCFPVSLSAQIITFQKTYGYGGGDTAEDMIQMPDSGFVVIGEVTNQTTVDYDVYLIRTDKYGDTLWTKQLGGLGYEFATFDMDITTDGLVMVVLSSSFGAGAYDYLVMKTNFNGDVMWAKSFGGSNWDFPQCIKSTNDGGYIVGGGTRSFGSGNYDMFILKLNSAGDTLWTKIYGWAADQELISDIVELPNNNGYIMSGYTYSVGSGGNDALLLRTDSIGNIKWTKTIGTPDDEGNMLLLKDSDSLLYCYFFNDTNTFLSVIDTGGVIKWTKKYFNTSAPDFNGYSLIKSKNNFVFGGKTGDKTTPDIDLCMVKIDAAGTILEKKGYGSNTTESYATLIATNDGGYLLGGNTYGFGGSNPGLYLIKTDSLGNSGCNEKNIDISSVDVTFATIDVTPIESKGSILVTNPVITIYAGGEVNTLCFNVGLEELEVSDLKLEVYPNPSDGKFQVQSLKFEIEKVEVYNILGERVIQIPLTPFVKGELTIDLSSQPNGIYNVVVRGKGFYANEKVVILH